MIPTRPGGGSTLHTTYNIDMSVKVAIFEALAYIVFSRGRSLVWTKKKASENFEVKVDVQKGVLKFREEIIYVLRMKKSSITF